MDILPQFIIDFIGILNEMSPYLLLGFLFAGMLKVFLPQSFIDKHLAQSNFQSVFYASLLGIPMPLCSCGVIPTGVSIYKNGASKGSTVSFLISTPQTGVDSILATYSLLGLPFAIIRPIVALSTGVFGGLFTNQKEKNSQQKLVKAKTIDETCSSDTCCSDGNCETEQPHHSKIYTMFKYAFVDFLQDIYKWLLIGVLLAATISVLVPNHFFEQLIGNQLLEMLIILLVATPLYVCATGSIPIAAVLMLKGLSPGAALVFLMAGPATNIATITVLKKKLGTRTMWKYLFSIILGAILFGLLINIFAPREWFNLQQNLHIHNHFSFPNWVKWGSTIILTLLIINAYNQKIRNKTKSEKENSMNTKTIIVNGMNCNHCKNSVEKNIGNLEGVKSVEVNLQKKIAIIEGDSINLKKIEEEITELGFKYGGELTQ